MVSLRGIFSALGFLVLIASLMFGLSFAEHKFNLGPRTVPAVISLVGLVFGVVGLSIMHRSQRTISAGSRAFRRKTTVVQYIGLIVCIVGVALGLGNITGAFGTTAYAGTFTSMLGAIIYALGRVSRKVQ
jgi:membrane associated rhomboid family serine protease